MVEPRLNAHDIAVSGAPESIGGTPALSDASLAEREVVQTASVTRLAALERWLLRGTTFVLPLTYWWLTYDGYVLPKLLVARFLVLGLATLFAARIALTRKLTVRRTALDLPLVAFIGSAVLSALVGINQTVGIFGTYARYDGVLTVCTYAALFWLTTQSIADRGEARTLVRILVGGGFVVAVIAIIQWIVDSVAGAPVPRAFGTMGNANVLGAYLVLLCPAAFGELVAAKSAIARVLAGNALVAMTLAILLSLSRSSWLSLAVAGTIILLGRQLRAPNARRILAAVSVALVAVVAVALGGLLLVQRPGAASSTETLSARLHVWQDTLPLIASRPLAGYGPDTFGLVYPRFQTGNWAYYAQFDKAHSELLQVAATQGLAGVASYLWLLLAFVVSFLRGPKSAESWILFAGWVGYQTTLQLNFTALPAALPFWIFAAAAVAVWGQDSARGVRTYSAPRVARPAAAAVLVVVAVLTIPALVMPYLADRRLREAVDADISGQTATAMSLAAQARELAPQESVYAVEDGNIAFERDEWAHAREAYSSATRLGSFNPQMYRNLALADQRLGLIDEALVAARTAIYLNRFDPVNDAILAQVEASRP